MLLLLLQLICQHKKREAVRRGRGGKSVLRTNTYEERTCRQIDPNKKVKDMDMDGEGGYLLDERVGGKGKKLTHVVDRDILLSTHKNCQPRYAQICYTDS